MLKSKSLKQQRLDGELGLIIYEMARAMWNANKTYIARSVGFIALTPNMKQVLRKFKAFCEERHGEES